MSACARARLGAEVLPGERGVEELRAGDFSPSSALPTTVTTCQKLLKCEVAVGRQRVRVRWRAVRASAAFPRCGISVTGYN